MSCGLNTIKDILAVAGLKIDNSNISASSTESYEIKNTAQNIAVLGAVVRNRSYIETLRKEASKYLSAVSNASLRNTKTYYNRLTGKYQNYLPSSKSGSLGNKDLFIEVAQQLANLVANRVVSDNTKLDVFPIDTETGEKCQEDDGLLKQQLSEILQLPMSGTIMRGDRPNQVDKFGYTYTSVDIDAWAIFGTTAVQVKGLTGISWSRHKDKNPDRTTYTPTAAKRTHGAKTYAGSMIFALFDEDPIRAISPSKYFDGHSPIVPSSGITNYGEVDSLDMPGFDMEITFTNEYGSVSIMHIWGVDFTDDGGSITTRQNEQEVVYKYEASRIDPIKPTERDDDGIVGGLTGSYAKEESFFARRRAVLIGEAMGANFEDMYQDTIKGIYN